MDDAHSLTESSFQGNSEHSDSILSGTSGSLVQNTAKESGEGNVQNGNPIAASPDDVGRPHHGITLSALDEENESSITLEVERMAPTTTVSDVHRAPLALDLVPTTIK